MSKKFDDILKNTSLINYSYKTVLASNTNVLSIKVFSDNMPSIEDIKTIFDGSYELCGNYKLKIVFSYPIDLSVLSANILKTYIDIVIKFYKKVTGLSEYTILEKFKTKYENETFYYIVDKNSEELGYTVEKIERLLHDLGIDISVKIDIDENLLTKKEELQIKNDSLVKNAKELYNDTLPKYIKINEIPYDNYQMLQYTQTRTNNTVIISGKIVKALFETTGKAPYVSTRITFSIKDDSDDIINAKYSAFKNASNKFSSFKENDNVTITGDIFFDQYQKEVVINMKDIEYCNTIKDEVREDNEEEKRIEFHIHTKMSQMDAVIDTTSLVNTLASWNHKAFAVTDHNAIYAFPDIEHIVNDVNKTRENKIKPIYGVELDFINEDYLHITRNVDEDILLKDACFCFFDFETTGLLANYDSIIEIGALKTKPGVFNSKETFQSLIKPPTKLSSKITEITHITDEMLEHERSEETVFPIFVKFLEDVDILVAHNATFDIRFFYETCKRLGIKTKKFMVIDTLILFRFLYNQTNHNQRSTLQSAYNKLVYDGYIESKKIAEDQTSGYHRALYDTEILGEVWFGFQTLLKKSNITKYNDIDKIFKSSNPHLFSNPYHINVLVKNRVGLKNLYNIISLALTTTFNNRAITLQSNIVKHREGLLLGSGCVNGDVFEMAISSSIEDLEKRISYYDYIEVQPPAAYKQLINGFVSEGLEKIQDVIKKIITTAKKLNKLVIATSDAHYLNKEDKIYREIFIRTKSVGGGLHPLKRYKSEDLPEQYLLTTKEMLDSFSFLGTDLAKEIVITNPNLLEKQIEHINIFPKEKLFIRDNGYLDSLNIESCEKELKKLVSQEITKLYGDNPHKIILDRKDKELEKIFQYNYSSIYYTARLLVKKSNSDGYVVGSRGSVGSSYVATLLGITEVNPLPPHYYCSSSHFQFFELTDQKEILNLDPSIKTLQDSFKGIKSGYDLPENFCPICGKLLLKDGHNINFETFLGFKGDKTPDIDLNFSGDYQASAHNYVRELLGHNYAFRAGTVMTVAEKTAFGYVKGYFSDNEIPVRGAKIGYLADKITGVKRTTGQHAGGIVVVPKDASLLDVTPFQYPAEDVTNDWYTTHFDYHSFEEILLKLDILGHDDPTIVKFLMDYVTLHPNEFPFKEYTDIPLDDPNIYRLFNDTEIIGIPKNRTTEKNSVLGLPEFGTNFVKGMLASTSPKSFGDLVKISGLSHGTDVWLGNAEDLVTGKTKYGKLPFDKIISCRDDIMETLIREYNVPSATAFEIMEFVRKGKPSENKEKWDKYVKILQENNVPEWYIYSCGLIKYMFPRAHATAYVIMAVRIAWFKLYKPLLFYSSYFSRRVNQYDYDVMIGTEKDIERAINSINSLSKLERKKTDDDLLITLGVALEMAKRGFKFYPLDINLSEAQTFTICENGLRMPFDSIGGMGLSAANDLVTSRQEKPFTSKKDVKERCIVREGQKRTIINKTVYEKMLNGKAFDSLPDEDDNSILDMGLFAFIDNN
ncbi:MAG: PolC-type DNA polymerase III [Acholeplasmatales bacterium]|jgi:DNA polymerase-3 subunit alpha (Gram-positive type)|nr:PolC-type DNA polymerase III [Acholeplasmatales bacterium]